LGAPAVFETELLAVAALLPVAALPPAEFVSLQPPSTALRDAANMNAMETRAVVAIIAASRMS
jgi:hypothetical protein